MYTHPMHTTMKKLTFLSASAIFALCILTMGARDAHAQTAIAAGPTAGYAMVNGTGNFALGADARIGLSALPVIINPTLEYYFVGQNVTQFKLSANALYAFDLPSPSITPYAGAGLAYLRTSVDIETDVGTFSGNASDVGLNLLGGAIFEAGSLSPFAQAKFTLISGSSLISLGGGVLFSF